MMEELRKGRQHFYCMVLLTLEKAGLQTRETSLNLSFFQMQVTMFGLETLAATDTVKTTLSTILKQTLSFGNRPTP